MELTYLQTFLEVVRSGSFTQAADRLGYAQSSITAQIHKLEAAYGIVLFERYGRKIRLTPAGETLLPYARDLVKLHLESKEAVSKQSKGSLAIGTVETLAAFFLPPYLQTYRRQYPDMNVTMQPANESHLIEAVKAGLLDIGFILDPPFMDAELHTAVIREETLVIAVHPEHRFSSRHQIGVEDLRGESLILTEEGCTYRAMLLKALKDGVVPCQFTYEFGNIEAIKQGVLHGLGIALLPELAVKEEIRSRRLAAAPFVHPTNRFCTQLIYSKKKWLSKPFQDFLALITG